MNNISLNIRWILMTAMLFSWFSSIADTIPRLSNSLIVRDWRILNNDTVNKLYPGGIYIVHPKYEEFLLPKSEIRLADDGTLIIPPTRKFTTFRVNIKHLTVADTAKWHPKAIYIILPDRKLTFRLPCEKDQDPSGVANLLFQCRETGKIHLHDTIKGGHRSFNSSLMSGEYDAILLYNNGKYIRYNNVVFEEDADKEVNMEKLGVQPPDVASQHWLTLRTFNTPTWERIYHKYYSAVSEKKIRGYIYDYRGKPYGPGLVIATDDIATKWTRLYHDGYFEFDVDPNQTLKISERTARDSHIPQEIKITESCGLIVWMEGAPYNPNSDALKGRMGHSGS